MSLNKYSDSNKPNIKINKDILTSLNNNVIINQTNSFNIQTKITNQNNCFLLKRNNNKKYMSYKYNRIKKNKDIINRYKTPFVKKKIIINSFLDNNSTLFNKEKNNDKNQIYELKFKNIFKNNYLIRSKSYNKKNIHGKEIDRFSPRIKKKVQNIYKILESSNFNPINTYKLNKISNITNYNREMNKNKVKNNKSQKNFLIKCNSFLNNENLMKCNNKNRNILETFKIHDNNNYENNSNNFQKINKNNIYQKNFYKETIKDNENEDNNNNIIGDNSNYTNNLKLNKNLINYLNKYKGEQKKNMEECLSTLNFNYADDNFNYNFQINYNDLNNSNDNQKNEKLTNNYKTEIKINENSSNNSQENENEIKNVVYKENFNIMNMDYFNENKIDEKKINDNGIKKECNYKKVNYKKYNFNKDKNIKLNIFNNDEDILFINKKINFPMSNEKKKYYHSNSLFFGDIDNTSNLIKKPKTKLELLLTKIPRHVKLNENQKNKYSINIHRFLNQKKNNANNFKKDFNSIIGLQSKKRAVMPPNNYSNEFIKKVFTSFYLNNI